MQGDSPGSGRSDYLDFDLEIETGTGRDYPVAVLDSPAGSARGNMHFPFDDLVLENRLLTLQNALLRSGGEPRRALSSEEQAVRDFGQTLFEALFTAEVRSCFDVSLREAARQGRGLRLKLRIQPPELAALPWEYLYHPGQAEYVSLSTQTPVVRYLEVPQRVQPLMVKPPLRVLGMIASPSDLPSLDVEREKGRIEQATRDLQARGLMDLVWLPGQSWRDLQRAMRQGTWHIFHFIGHGGFDHNTGEGLIALADREGRATRFHATRLGRMLADHASLRLVLLNSCESARGSERDVFSSAASILVRRGIPAVLAMQYEITDRAAVEFARTFYEALADGMAIDGAVAEARKAISFAVANTVEWGTPVLYTRSPGGVLFEVAGGPRVERPPTEESRPPPTVKKEQEQRLEQLYVDGLAAFWVEEWDEARHCFAAIVDERPGYRDAGARLQEAERQGELTRLYAQAQAAREGGDWSGALSALQELVAAAPDFKDAAALLETAKSQKRLADLYAQARQLHQAGQWQAVVNIFARIVALDPKYPDPEALLSTAEREVAEQERQGELNDLYSHALLEMDVGQWAEAQGLLAQIQEVAPGYRETERLLAKAEAEITAREKPAPLAKPAPPKRGLPTWAVAAIGGLAVVALIAVAVMMGGGLGGVESTSTPTPTTKSAPESTDALVTEEVRMTPDTGGARSATETAEAAGRMGMTTTAEAVAWLGTRTAAEATQTAMARPTDLPATPSDTPTVTPTWTPTLTPTPQAGATRIWEKDNSAMVYVPAGAFWMGSSDEEIDALLAECSTCQRASYTDEQPQHAVTLDAFWIDRTEVTNVQYRRCVEEGMCSPPSDFGSFTRDSYYDDPGFDDYPVIFVNWQQANAYCTWANKRLPTEAEWEKAARGMDRFVYPWGNSFDGSVANFCDVNCARDRRKNEDWDDGYADTAPVGSYKDGASPYGALDMAGNVQEWVADWYAEDYYAISPDSKPPGPDTGTDKGLGGGSWNSRWNGVRAAHRSHDQPDYTGSIVGFRCAVSPGE